jgi:Tannase-like family of unknown function (DUF6351)
MEEVLTRSNHIWHVRTEMKPYSTVAVAMAMAAGLAWAGLMAQSTPLTLSALSNRADLVSGGDVLLEVKGIGTSAAGLAVTANGRDVTSAFVADSKRGSLVGLVKDLRNGDNTVEAKAGSKTTKLTVTNHPIVGPVLSGPHMTPLVCRTEESGLGKPTDADCSAPAKVEHFYRSNAPAPPAAGGRGRGAAASPFKPWPTGARPADIDQVKLPDGRSVPYIVRVESGTINRSIYRIGILDDPATANGQAWRPGAAWNGRLMFSFGGGCGTNYDQGDNQATGALNDAALSRGFAFAISTQNVMGQHCNDALSGEALMMIKEHFIERYGVPVWTVGIGGSGGAIQQLLIGQNYPGLLDGLMPSLTFPDSISLRSGVADCRLFLTYYRAHPDAFTDAQKAAIEGHTTGTCGAWDRGLANVILADYAQGCGIPAELVYHPTKNPKGARCTLWDTNVNSFGRDPKTGFARRSYDNIGVQFGLKALNDAAITKAQFLDLNEGIGGYDNDGHPRPERTQGDPEGVRLAYYTGRLNSAGGPGLGSVPILQYRSYNDARGDIHDRFRDFSVRERLKKSYGRFDNQAIWLYGQNAPNVTGLAIDTMSAWLDALVKDTSARPAIEKVVAAKPARAIDGCWDAEGKRVDEIATFDGTGRCNTLYPVHTNPRLVAGAPVADDVLKCQLKPIASGDYKVSFTADEMARLRRVFPAGVCDYSKPGVHVTKLAGTFLKLPVR